MQKTGCLICGQPLQYFSEQKQVVCEYCGKEAQTDVTCENGHYVCNACHAQKGYEKITDGCLAYKGKDPLALAQQLMEGDYVNMHGPEHHYLVPAVLLTACHNAGAELDLQKALSKALTRAKQVPGGICGMWGSCGAAIGAGIYWSVLTGATPVSEEEWSRANKMTSLALSRIAECGGPRCCKRDSFLAIQQAVEYTKEQLGIEMQLPERVTCAFHALNRECRQSDCLFFHSEGTK